VFPHLRPRITNWATRCSSAGRLRAGSAAPTPQRAPLGRRTASPRSSVGSNGRLPTHGEQRVRVRAGGPTRSPIANAARPCRTLRRPADGAAQTTLPTGAVSPSTTAVGVTPTRPPAASSRSARRADAHAALRPPVSATAGVRPNRLVWAGSARPRGALYALIRGIRYRKRYPRDFGTGSWYRGSSCASLREKRGKR
jgi:hypothetical protein